MTAPATRTWPSAPASPARADGQEDGLNQSASLRFVVGNVNLEALSERITELGRPSSPPELHMGFARGHTDAPKVEALIDLGVEEGVWTDADAAYIQFFSVPGRPGELAFNCPRVTYVNGAKAEDLTRVQIEGRKIIPQHHRLVPAVPAGL